MYRNSFSVVGSFALIKAFKEMIEESTGWIYDSSFSTFSEEKYKVDPDLYFNGDTEDEYTYGHMKPAHFSLSNKEGRVFSLPEEWNEAFYFSIQEAIPFHKFKVGEVVALLRDASTGYHIHYAGEIVTIKGLFANGNVFFETTPDGAGSIAIENNIRILTEEEKKTVQTAVLEDFRTKYLLHPHHSISFDEIQQTIIIGCQKYTKGEIESLLRVMRDGYLAIRIVCGNDIKHEDLAKLITIFNHQ